MRIYIHFFKVPTAPRRTISRILKKKKKKKKISSETPRERARLYNPSGLLLLQSFATTRHLRVRAPLSRNSKKPRYNRKGNPISLRVYTYASSGSHTPRETTKCTCDYGYTSNLDPLVAAALSPASP